MNFFIKTENKGSALLVVLGFLTFMIISAVSFSIYMRVERQASSNYRHSITARHLLESSLFRAMDEVDADLRGARYTYPGEKPVTPDAPPTKFPYHWTNGCIFVSQSNTPEQEKARVLSLEALSFLPASLVNDARVASASSVEWRRMSMPIESSVSIMNNNAAQSSENKSYVGRYAYICVNLSDMLNINGCTAASMRSASNLISVASLFVPGKEVEFEKQRIKDLHYTTQQDFYACMATAFKYDNQKNNYFVPSFNGPSIEVLKDNGNLNTYFNDAYNHLLVTDGFAKVPASAVSPSCNVTLNQPIPFLAGGPQAGIPGTVMSPYVDLGFAAKLTSLFLNELSRFGSPFWATLYDYLALDTEATYRLDAPSSKLTPMICQVRLADQLTPVIRIKDVNKGQPNATQEYMLHVVQNTAVVQSGLGLQVRVCYPFKDVGTRNNGNLKLTVAGFIRVDKQGSAPNTSSQISGALPPADKEFTALVTVTPPIITSSGNAQTLQDSCYQWIPIPITTSAIVGAPAGVIKLATKEVSSGVIKPEPGFGPNINLSVVITKMTIQQSSTLVFDQVPAYPPGPAATDDPKLYFQTGNVSITPAMGPLPDGSQGCLIPYLWDSLETPDPRFNHYVVNWFSNGKHTAVNGTTSVLDPGYQAAGMHQLTKDLLGEDGRDADIFMASSAQKVLQSVGELGFIVRPYLYDFQKGKKHVDFQNKQYTSKVSLDPAKDESDAFFRTIRLYDHVLPGVNLDNPTTVQILQQKRDKIYENFYMALDKDGTLPLASNVRVNPLTTAGLIIECALDRVPYNFGIANGGSTLSPQNFTEGVLKNKWIPFVEKWSNLFTNEVRDAGINTSFEKKISDFYGDANHMGWYSPEKMVRQTIFIQTPNAFDATVPIFEIDRKMLYAFSLDSMSDRQQLFLYVFQAEAVAPISFAEMRSLAGGRAVALVWRDPYPKGSMPGTPNGLQSSWYNNSTSGGTKGYHEQKILFFKQLDN